MFARSLLIGCTLVGLCAAPLSGDLIIYVDANATLSPHHGASWCHAFLTLQEAIDSAGAVPPPGTIIRVANGTYKPTVEGDRNAAFTLKNNVTIEGGYAGCGDGEDVRDIHAYRTILSGDIGVAGVAEDNCYHVVIGSGTDATAGLDGCVITGGQANGGENDNFGGGLFIEDGSPTISQCSFIKNVASTGAGICNFSGTPTITDCTFIKNTASGYGAGMYNLSGDSTLTNCVFSRNAAGDYGGGMHSSSCHPTITNCVFAGNSSQTDGGGLYGVYSNSLITNSSFTANTAAFRGGGLACTSSHPMMTNCSIVGNSASDSGGGMLCAANSSPVLTNCVFHANAATGDRSDGGAISNTGYSAPMIINCTFNANYSSHHGGAVFNKDCSPILTNSILWDNYSNAGPQIYNDVAYPVVSFCCVQGGYGTPPNSNIAERPLLVAGSLHLAAGSPCIDAGNNAAIPSDTPNLDKDLDTGELIPWDLRGQSRFRDDPATPDTGPPSEPDEIVDIGAYELQPITVVGDMNADGLVNGEDIQLFIDAVLAAGGE